MFRTRFLAKDEGPEQVVTPLARLTLLRADLTGLAAEARKSELAHRLETEAKRPFDLAHDLLLRALLVQLAPDEHVLMLVMHHIVSDGWSLGLLFRELGILHEAYSSGKVSPLPELPIRFSDFALWERETLQGDALEKPLAYWRRQLAGATPLELLTDKPRPAEPAARGATQLLPLSAGLVQDLKALSQQEGATLFMTLLAGFQALLHRYTGQDDVVVGSCVAGRPQVELENLAGFFVNTIVLRTNAGGQPTFRELLRRTRETVLGAMAHQDLPFEKIVAELQPDRSPARNPFFQVMFVLQSATGAQPQSAGLTFTPVEVDNGTAKFDLTFSLTEAAGNLVISVEYRTDLFEPATISRMVGHFHRLLEGAAADPARRITELPMLAPAEREQLLGPWAGESTPYPRDASVVDLFREQVRYLPETVAVSGTITRLTYRELEERSNRLAHFLTRHGAGPGTMVAFCCERSAQLAVLMLGILKAGAAYVALDPNYPASRLGLMIADSRSRLILTQDHRRAQIDEAIATAGLQAPPTVISLDRAKPQIDAESAEPSLMPIAPESIAYVCYTSGSTGRPKGVTVPHRAIVRLVRNTNYITCRPGDVWLGFATIAFDASTIEFWGPLLNGARVAVFPPGMPSLAELADFIRLQGITDTFLTTGLFNQLVDEQLEQLGGIRNLFTGGEVLSPAHAARVRARWPHLRLVNVYGPTENTTFTTFHDIDAAPESGQPVPIGRPISNTTVYVLDAHRQLVPIGVPGELYTGGDGVATGYLGRPELTAERFVPNPFAGADGARPESATLYRTGDLVRWRTDGTLEFLGRADRQVKLRGFRIELGEVEAAISQHSSVGQTVVLHDPSAVSGARLVAYVTGRGPHQPDLVGLKAHLQKSLPEHLVPAVFMPLREIPLNGNGKVDRAALPKPDAAPLSGRPPIVAPRDEIETRVAEIWSRTLGVSPIGVHDSFFQLGGHSMAGVRMFARIEKEFGRRLPLASLFECPTVEQLAARLRAPESSLTCSSLVALQPHGTRPPVFFVHGAGGGNLWTYTNLVPHLAPDQPVYALESRGMRGMPEFETVEEMAAHYLKEIRTVQPHGPYYFSGYCFGGNVAFEMARQLEAKGERVAFLGLLDSAAANSTYQQLPWWRPTFHVRFMLNTARWLGDFLKQSPREQVRFVRRKARTLSRRVVGRALGRAEQPNVEEVIDTSIFPEIELDLWKIHLQAMSRYHAGRYGGRIVLFRTAGHPFLCSFDPHFGWGPLVGGGIEDVPVPGAHEGIFMEPYVRELSAQFRHQLELAQQHHHVTSLSSR